MSRERKDPSQYWGPEAMALARQAQVLSGIKLDQLVRRLQRQTGHNREECWRFVIQYGLKGRVEHRRWTDEEMEAAREGLVKYSVEEVAKKLHRSAKALRCMLQRNHLAVREIRCDCFSAEGLAGILHIRKMEVISWIEQDWLEATVRTYARRRCYFITPEAFIRLYKLHLRDLLNQRRISNLALFEAFFQYCYTPKHTLGEQLLDVRRDKKERAAYAALSEHGDPDESEEEDDENPEAYDLRVPADLEFVESPDDGD